MSGEDPVSAGRSTPGTLPNTILAIAMQAPVFPAERKPSALPEETRRAQTASSFPSVAGCFRRVIVHSDPLGSVDHFDRQIPVVFV